ncbi:hypothetical protein J1605_011615 [Eschrichtius robustus]|uniref:Uncharacterized protein n=1 Tax=Eschrichtius robustus TaxID=9764 RepID=A0AB34GNF7_ESCRO|nr:hypothetical protein J1605_011615 [Eschrichtius robustus]
MSGARRAAGGESGPPGRGKHRAPRRGLSGQTPPSARREPSSAARARPVLQRRRQRPRRRQPRERPGRCFPGRAEAGEGETPSKLYSGFGRGRLRQRGPSPSRSRARELVRPAGKVWSPR